MRTVIKDIRDIKDSKEMYESKPHPFIGIFIYIVLTLIILVSIWMYFGEIDIVSKGAGVVRPNESLSSIRNKTAGEVASSNLQEGKVVKAGDILFTISYDDLEISRKQAEESLKELEVEGKRLKKLKASIEQGKNLFSKETEQEDYEAYVKYEQDYKTLESNNKIEAKNEDLTVSQTTLNQSIYNEKIATCEADYKTLEVYKQSVEKEESLFEDMASSKALEFKNYMYQIKALRLDAEAKKEIYLLNTSLNEEELVASQELEQSKDAYELAEDKVTALKNETLENITSQMKTLKDEIQNLKQENSKLMIDEALLNEKDAQRALSLKVYKTNYLVDLYHQIDENNLAYSNQKLKLESILLAIKNCQIVAPIDGTIHIVNNITPGDFIATADNIATIIPMEDSLYTIEIFMPNSEIAGLKIGDLIKYNFDALPYKEYGQMEGKITSISTDAQFSETYGTSGYIVKGTVNNETVYSYKGEAAQIKVGMTCEAHIITEQKKILHYLLEKINLKD